MRRARAGRAAKRAKQSARNAERRPERNRKVPGAEHALGRPGGEAREARAPARAFELTSLPGRNWEERNARMNLNADGARGPARRSIRPMVSHGERRFDACDTRPRTDGPVAFALRFCF